MQAVSKDKWSSVFGAPDHERTHGRQKLCRTCGGWHLVDAWPHNCMAPDWRPPQYLPAPMVVADVPEHVAEPGWVIGSRSDQREYMRRTGRVEWEDFPETAGTHRQHHEKGTAGYRTYEQGLVADIKRAMEEDPLNRPPPMMIEEANSQGGETEAVTMEGVEVIGDEHSAAA